MTLILVDEEVADFGMVGMVTAGEEDAGGELFSELLCHLVGGEIFVAAEKEAGLGEVGGEEGRERSQLIQKGLGGAGLLQKGTGGGDSDGIDDEGNFLRGEEFF